MRRLHHHAARGVGLLLHRLATLALGLAILLVALLFAGAWWLSHGPVDLDWFTHRLESAVNGNGGPLRLSIGSTALAWEGFRLGVDRPLDLRLTDIRVSGVAGEHRVDIPRAEVSLSLLALLRGEIQPRALELDNPRLTLRRAANGGVSIDLGTASAAAAPPSGGTPLPALLTVLAKPPTTDQSDSTTWFSQLRRVRIHDAAVTVIDQGLGATWYAPSADATLNRRPQGGIEGVVNMSLALGAQTARLTAEATLAPDAASTHITAHLGPVQPALLARAVAAWAPLAAVDAPINAEASAELDANLGLREGRLTMRAGAGMLRVGDSAVPIKAASLTATGTPDLIRLEAARLLVDGHPGAPPTALTATGVVHRGEDRMDADLGLTLDQVAFADLPALWPQNVAPDARAWVLQNITAGTASDGQVSLGLAASNDLSRVALTRVSGAVQGSDLVVSWLRPVPPIIGGRATLHILDPDTLQIDMSAGQEQVHGGKLTVTGGTFRISGLTQRRQFGRLQIDVAGTLPDALDLLREPRLQLLDRHPVPLKNPSGDVAGTVTVNLPLESAVRIDDVAIGVAAHIDHAGLSDVVAGRALSDGKLALTADNNGLTLKGQGRLGGIPADLDGAMDFRTGPPSQVVQRAAIKGHADAEQLAAAGIDVGDMLGGTVGMQALVTEQRDGTGTVALDGDLSDASLIVTQLGWHRPLGAKAHAVALLRLRDDRLESIDHIVATGDGVTLQGEAQCQNGQVARITFDRLVLGRSDMQGSVTLPPKPRSGPIAVQLSGPLLDLSARLEAPHKPEHGPRAEPPPGPPWTLDARFDRVLMAHGYLLASLTAQASNDGRVFRSLRVAGATREKGPFLLQIAAQGGRRHLTATAAQAGDLLRALDVTGTMTGGTLSVSGDYDDTTPAHALHGTAELTDFHIARAAALGKLLQAMTLYGLADVMRGPGIAFSRMVAPFGLSDGVLDLSDARAFSPSLGLTAKGRIDLDGNRADLRGTIVPAYFFNSLLGSVPLVGRLFSPERGGGVFAASYSLSGDLDDPQVTVNPLAALTPGFLRGLFGLF